MLENLFHSIEVHTFVNYFSKTSSSRGCYKGQRSRSSLNIGPLKLRMRSSAFQDIHSTRLSYLAGKKLKFVEFDARERTPSTCMIEHLASACENTQQLQNGCKFARCRSLGVINIYTLPFILSCVMKGQEHVGNAVQERAWKGWGMLKRKI